MIRSVVISLIALLVTVATLTASEFVINQEGKPVACALGTSLLYIDDTPLCIDAYESSAAKSCPVPMPQNNDDTVRNVVTPGCRAVSVPDVLPWVYVSHLQATQLCAQQGKRLLTAREWTQLALGVQGLSDCNVAGAGTQIHAEGEHSCVTPDGIFDVVGNAWEWVTPLVVAGSALGATLPESGYVVGWLESGLPSKTATTSAAAYGHDYTSIQHEGERAIMRGGYYGSGEDAGVFALNATLAPDMSTGATGFRCVYELRL